VLALVDNEPIDVAGHDWGAAITYTLCMLAPARIRRAVTLACPHPRTLLRMLRDPAQLRRSWYMAFFQLPFAARIARSRDFALIDRLWRTWSPNFTLDPGCRKMLHDCLSKSWPAPIRYYQPQRLRGDCITTPLLQLHGSDDGCIAPPTDEDSFRFRERVLEIVPRTGHFLHLEDPSGIATRIRNWFA
jgi:pimeloyl-ACP methyl ester carboxylesterase